MAPKQLNGFYFGSYACLKNQERGLNQMQSKENLISSSQPKHNKYDEKQTLEKI